MHYLLKPLVRAMRTLNDRELKLSIIIGIVLFVAGTLELLNCSSHNLISQTASDRVDAHRTGIDGLEPNIAGCSALSSPAAHPKDFGA